MLLAFLPATRSVLIEFALRFVVTTAGTSAATVSTVTFPALSLPPLPLSRLSRKPLPPRLPPRGLRPPFPPSPFACAGSTEIRRPSTSKPFIESMTRLASPSSTSKNEKLSRKSIRPIRTLPGTHLLTNSIS